jgi:hypothetical protein
MDGRIFRRIGDLMATLAPIAPKLNSSKLNTSKFDRAIFLARHREYTEQAIARIREDAFLTDRERAQRITQIVADANARVLARAASRVW